ncbi:MAG: NUDIX domain-containing protein [Flavisolibacter sp.]|nr:NUDIX domain-containing protein [Flavisolibacter sp.]
MNTDVIIKETEVLSQKRFALKNYSIELKKKDGHFETQQREIYEHGNAIAVLLFNKERKTVILTRQFRLASYLNGNKSGYLIEACAGLLDGDRPEEVVKKEVKEEIGYEIKKVQKVFEAYMSPGAFTEKIYFFVAEYTAENKISEGGGLKEEQEEIEVMEMELEKAYALIESGEVQDAKTILLLQYAKINGLV